jgi:hypothetical protein
MYDEPATGTGVQRNVTTSDADRRTVSDGSTRARNRPRATGVGGDGALHEDDLEQNRSRR